MTFAIWSRTHANALPIAPAKFAAIMAAENRAGPVLRVKLARLAVRARARQGRFVPMACATIVALTQTVQRRSEALQSAGSVSRIPVGTTVDSVRAACAVSRHKVSSVIASRVAPWVHWAGIHAVLRCHAALDIPATSSTAIRGFAGSNPHREVLVTNSHGRHTCEVTADPGRASGPAVDTSSVPVFRVRSVCHQFPCAAIWSNFDLSSRCCSASSR